MPTDYLGQDYYEAYAQLMQLELGNGATVPANAERREIGPYIIIEGNRYFDLKSNYLFGHRPPFLESTQDIIYDYEEDLLKAGYKFCYSLDNLECLKVNTESLILEIAPKLFIIFSNDKITSPIMTLPSLGLLRFILKIYFPKLNSREKLLLSFAESLENVLLINDHIIKVLNLDIRDKLKNKGILCELCVENKSTILRFPLCLTNSEMTYIFNSIKESL